MYSNYTDDNTGKSLGLPNWMLHILEMILKSRRRGYQDTFPWKNGWRTFQLIKHGLPINLSFCSDLRESCQHETARAPQWHLQIKQIRENIRAKGKKKQV